MRDTQKGTLTTQVARAVQGLIREVKNKRWGLEQGRALAYEQIRSLNIDPHTIDFLLRQVAEQNSKQGMVEVLESFAASLPCKEPPGQALLFEIAARKVNVNKHDLGVIEEWYTIVPLQEVLYAFIGSALWQEIIRAPWKSQKFFRRDGIYLRVRNGLYLTDYRSLTELRECMDPHFFIFIDRSLLVNIGTHHRLSFRERIVSFAYSDGAPETLRISKRHVRPLRERLGARARVK